MMKKRFDRNDMKRDLVRHNEQIRIPQVQVVQDGHNLGVMSTRDALQLARTFDLDLVEVAPTSRPPVCHIMDYGEYMYRRSKDKHRPTVIKEKEITFRYVIDEHDLETKADQARRFLEKGMKVKLSVRFKAREKAHKDQGFVVLNRMIEALQDVAMVEMAPRFDGGNVMAKLDLKKELKQAAKRKETA